MSGSLESIYLLFRNNRFSCFPRGQTIFSPPFPHFSSRIHTRCTTSASCPSHPARLPSNEAYYRPVNSTNFGLSGENPQQNPPFLAPPAYLHPINTGIRTANTTCCALYLTDPTEGVTFTTATPQDISRFASLLSLLCRRRLPAGFNQTASEAREVVKDRAQTH